MRKSGVQGRLYEPNTSQFLSDYAYTQRLSSMSVLTFLSPLAMLQLQAGVDLPWQLAFTPHHAPTLYPNSDCKYEYGYGKLVASREASRLYT